MPTISVFYGILIRMFVSDHVPPHFHAAYGEYEALIDINTLKVLRGSLPKRALNLVLEWAKISQLELLEDWKLCGQEKMPKKIKPLE